MSLADRVRQPTGEVAWPLVLLAGGAGHGKTYTALRGTASHLVSHGYIVSLGEDDPDEYKNIPGVSFGIVEHDGTYESILSAIRDVVSEPQGEKPALAIFDGGSKLWQLIVANKQAVANDRARRAALARKSLPPEGDADISRDLWNDARDEWYAVLDLLRTYPGPAVITARMEEVQLTANGVKTAEKVWRISGQVDLPFDVTAVIEIPHPGQHTLAKLKTAVPRHDLPRPWPEFELEDLWMELGLGTGTAGQRRYTAPLVSLPVAPTPDRDWFWELEKAGTNVASLTTLGAEASAASAPKEVKDAIRKALTAASKTKLAS